MENLHEQRQRLLLDVAPRIEIDTEPVELIFAIARAEPEHEAAVAQNIDECRVLGDPQRIGERERHHRGADLDPLGQRREIAGIHEHIRHDAVFVAEMMLGDPGVIEAERVGPHDLARHPRMDVPMRIGLQVNVGMRCEENSKFHALGSLMARAYQAVT